MGIAVEGARCFPAPRGGPGTVWVNDLKHKWGGAGFTWKHTVPHLMLYSP